ncbi:farnesyl-diphosphate farnesyltransferase [Angomonas deanei]|nr:farnesyl-diphosphate farnesyltransferase [Angomonas deanei]|eukprot:EPY31386.1 farnesyl-diphosphate farnesyltransferase [Angomonas deanei]
MGYLSSAMDMIRVKWEMKTSSVKLGSDQEDLRYCYDVLNSVSRSFAVVIQKLNDPDLRDGICIFYLVLRALDTIEDDMSIPVEFKLKELPKFHTHLDDPEWSMSNVGKGREMELLENFPRVSREFHKLKEQFQVVIKDICESMANGMCDFLQRPVVTSEDFDLYCFYVAGLVGHGLTRLFASCHYEDEHLADDLTNSRHMGLFLQKTNIIRDYFEDILEDPPRVFWPRDVWSKYAVDLKEFKDRANEKKGLECLNELVTGALQHIPYVIDYLSQLREPSVFQFCAIPQVMAMGTLAAVYNNPDTFHIKVKMTKAASCRAMIHSTDMYNTMEMFMVHIDEMMTKIEPQ